MREIFDCEWFLRRRKIHEIGLRVDADNCNACSGNVRGNVGAEWTPTTIATREEYERLIRRMFLLIELQFER
jgi:hypothetical protein